MEPALQSGDSFRRRAFDMAATLRPLSRLKNYEVRG
jgi:hypothetical protein